jgi:PhoD related phosphatase
LDADTDEDMVSLFMEDVDGKTLNNKHLLPRRNWCAMHIADSAESTCELDVVLNVEINCKNPEGLTKGYGIRIPMLSV